MAATIEITGLAEVQALLAGLGGELEKVNEYSQNMMALDIYDAEQNQIAADINRPTPWSVSSIRYKFCGTAKSGEPEVRGAAVYMLDAFELGSRVGPDEYLGVQILGGIEAGPKRSELILQGAGVLGRDQMWVPAKGADLDEFGNVPGWIMSKILADLGVGSGTSTGGANKVFYLFPPAVVAADGTFVNGKPVGIFAKTITGKLEPYLWFTKRATYAARFDWYGRADREVSAKFKDHIDYYLIKALEHLR